MDLWELAAREAVRHTIAAWLIAHRRVTTDGFAERSFFRQL